MRLVAAQEGDAEKRPSGKPQVCPLVAVFVKSLTAAHELDEEMSR
jgi:hypothetical protein